MFESWWFGSQVNFRFIRWSKVTGFFEKAELRQKNRTLHHDSRGQTVGGWCGGPSKVGHPCCPNTGGVHIPIFQESECIYIYRYHDLHIPQKSIIIIMVFRILDYYGFFFLIFNTYGLLLNHIKPIWIYELRLPWATPGVTPSGRKIVAKVAMSSGSVALDWVFLGKSTGNHGFYHEKYGWKLVQGQKTHGYSIGLF